MIRPGRRLRESVPKRDRRQPVLHLAAVLLPRAAVLRGAGLQVGRRRRDLDARPPGCACGVQLRLFAGRGVDPSIFDDKELIAVDNTPSSPHYGRIYVTYGPSSHIQPDGFSDYCPIQLLATRTRSQPRHARAVDLVAHRSQPDNPRRLWTAPVPRAEPVQRPGGERNCSALITSTSIRSRPDSQADSFEPAACSRREGRPQTGGQTFLPNAVQIDKAGQYADFDDGRVRTRSRADAFPRLRSRRHRWPTARRPASCYSSTRTTSTGRPLRQDDLVADLTQPTVEAALS